MYASDEGILDEFYSAEIVPKTYELLFEKKPTNSKLRMTGFKLLLAINADEELVLAKHGNQTATYTKVPTTFPTSASQLTKITAITNPT